MNISIGISACAVATTILLPQQSHAQTVLTGDTRWACEAILCLVTTSPPTECTPALKKYFSISFQKFKDTARGRANFLNMCPRSDTSTQVRALLSALGDPTNPPVDTTTVPAQFQ